MTNILWELPWVALSPWIFDGMHTVQDVIAQETYMRETPMNMYYWVMASFSSVDLRTVNHDPTFYVVELYAVANVAATCLFFYLNYKRSPHRYAVAMLMSGEPVAATFIFSFAEVFASYKNMSGGVFDTLLALVWTQYQYLIFPLFIGVFAYKLLLNDLKHVFTASKQS
eukprot:CAMPEP_0201562746 /NCGR_PEP_ID=MMETSP0173_2-20130828/79499_1 /ASSEMBLY_ACC=CAM_ASM_000268 /TAXON_ID=218659 /ORGANISM="Vexillifera sp., Strain DIVA3 564/2" /LENGTH=168 /DNA_ID=CAMNT_0047977345 /DNA_START=1328 /DNA_END=1837 /DNA_ORIENTATION=-